jgi:hypothetical protein
MRGLVGMSDDDISAESICLLGTLMSSSKNVLALLGVEFRLGAGGMSGRPAAEDIGAITVSVI